MRVLPNQKRSLGDALSILISKFRVLPLHIRVFREQTWRSAIVGVSSGIASKVFADLVHSMELRVVDALASRDWQAAATIRGSTPPRLAGPVYATEKPAEMACQTDNEYRDRFNRQAVFWQGFLGMALHTEVDPKHKPDQYT